jgi:hypothetical protein
MAIVNDQARRLQERDQTQQKEGLNKKMGYGYLRREEEEKEKKIHPPSF